MAENKNFVLCGDAYKKLQKIKNNIVNMCYVDPPFFTKRKFEIEKNGKFNSFDDIWDNDIHNYLEYMKKLFTECYRVLKNDGTIYIHCDWHAVHYLKIELDNIFGYDNFRNEIIWKRHNSHNDVKQGSKIFGRIHDTILVYSKCKHYTWNPIYAPYSNKHIKKYYCHIEKKTGRYYAYGDLSGPGGRSKGNPKFTFLGITRYWRYNEEKMKQLYKDGKIIQTKKGNVPVMKRYLDEMHGVPLQDIWDDVKSVQVSKNESATYPTQKPIRLLERIIEVSTNEKDLVLDPMCGSGSTLIAAKNLGRRYIGIDNNKQACLISNKRLTQNICLKISQTVS